MESWGIDRMKSYKPQNKIVNPNFIESNNEDGGTVLYECVSMNQAMIETSIFINYEYSLSHFRKSIVALFDRNFTI